MSAGHTAICHGCRNEVEVNGFGNCPSCQQIFDRMSGEFQSEEMPLDDLVAAIESAADSDKIIDILGKATPPVDGMGQQRARERLMRAMRGKVSSPSKVVDAWLRRSDGNGDQMIASQATELVRLVQDHNAVLFHTPDKQGFAAVMVDGHREVMLLRSRAFRLWLGRAYWEYQASEDSEESGRPGTVRGIMAASGPRVPAAQALVDATNTLEGLAIFGGEQHDVHVRVCHFGRNVYLDLGNEKWEAVEITCDGWRVISTPPVFFRRPPGLEALPSPEPGGKIGDLRSFLNVTNDEWPLVLGYIVGMFSPGPYAVAAVLGEQGSAKSTFTKVVRSLIDPNTALLRRKPRNDHDLAIAANNAWVITADNLSSMPVWLSDVLCTLATGGGFATRQLYSDADEQLFDSMRPVILNGIGDIVARSDLLDRAVLLTLPVLNDKVDEKRFWSEFELTRPCILGVILNAVAAAIAGVDDVELRETPRMVDFARWVTAAESALDLEEGAFLDAYLTNRAVADQTALDNSPIGRSVIRFAQREKEWEGTASELLSELNNLADEADGVSDDKGRIGPTRRQEGWPKAPNALSNRLKLLAPNLRRVNVEVMIGRDKHGSTITLAVVQDGQDRQGDQLRDGGPPDGDLQPCRVCHRPTDECDEAGRPWHVNGCWS